MTPPFGASAENNIIFGTLGLALSQCTRVFAVKKTGVLGACVDQLGFSGSTARQVSVQ